MESILTGNIWKQIAPQTRTAKRRLLAVAYVSKNAYLDLKRDDILICDASDHAIETRETSACLLHTLFRRGVELRSCPGLHAKMAVFGRYVPIGSCNLSSSSENDLTELALFTDRKLIVAQATAFVYGLREASEEIGGDFIRRILKIKVRRTPRQGQPRKERAIRFGNRVWLVSVQQLAANRFPKEQALVEDAQEKAECLMADKEIPLRKTRHGFRSMPRHSQAGCRPLDQILRG